MYRPQPDDPAALLWFISGVGLPSWSCYERQTRGTTCYLLAHAPPRPAVHRRETSLPPGERRRPSPQRRALLN